MRPVPPLLLVLLGVLLSGCGAARGIRVEASDTPPDQVGRPTGDAAIRELSATPVSGLPTALVETGSTVWVSTYAPGVQALDGRTGQLGGSIDTPSRAEVTPSIATSPGVLWILIRPDQGGSRLLHVAFGARSGEMTLTARQSLSSRMLPRDPFAYPRQTRIVGATRSALWLVSRSGTGYALWRRDLRSAAVRRFALASAAPPAVAAGADRVYALLPTGGSGAVVVQSRTEDGTVLSTSAPIHLQGAFQPEPLVTCGDRIFGWTRTATGAALFALPATRGSPRYSPRLPPRARPSKLTAIALTQSCRSIWVSTVSGSAGVVSRLSSTSLAPSRQLETSYVRALLWTGRTLWASDLQHQAVLRIR